jgi:uncharacterized protein with FMN-binding domain
VSAGARERVIAVNGGPLRRIAVSTTATVAGVLLLLSLKPHSTGGGGSGAVAGRAPAATSPGSGTSGAAGTGTVDGDAIQTRYGPVQVRVALSAGRITAVTVVQAPGSNPRDQEITDFAVPQLTQEALAAQSAGIDTVSGATYTSEGYIRSLQSALDKADG